MRVCGGEVEERAQLFGCPTRHLRRLRRPRRGRRRDTGDVAVHDALTLGIAQGLADQHVDLTGRALRERTPPVGAPDRRELCVEPIEVDGGDLLDWELAE